MSYIKRFIGDPGYTLDDLALRPEDYRRFGIETPEEREKRKAMPKIGDPGCTLDDLALKPEDYKRLGIETPEQRSRRAMWNDPEVVKRLNTPREDRENVIDLAKMREKKRSCGFLKANR